MNPNIFMIFKDGEYSSSFSSMRKLVSLIKDTTGIDVDASFVRKTLKENRSYFIATSDGDLEIRKTVLF